MIVPRTTARRVTKAQKGNGRSAGADRPSVRWSVGAGRLPGAEGSVAEAAGADLDAVPAVDLGGKRDAAGEGGAVDAEGPAGHVALLRATEVGRGLVAGRGGGDRARREALRGLDGVGAERGAGVGARRRRRAALAGGVAGVDGRLDVELLAGQAGVAVIDLHDRALGGAGAADVHAAAGAGGGHVEAAVHRDGGDVPALRCAAAAGGEHDAGAVGAGSGVEALARVAHRRDGPAAAVRGHDEDRGGEAGRLAPLLDGRGSAVHDHRVPRGDVGRERVLVAGVEHRGVAVVAPNGDAVGPGDGPHPVGVLHLLVAVGAALGGVGVGARRAAATDPLAEVADVDGGVGVHRALAGRAGAEGVGVGGAALVGAESAGDDAGRAGREASAVTVVRRRAVDRWLTDVGERSGVHDVAEERPFLHREVHPIDAPADCAVVRVEPERDVDAGGVDVGHHAGREPLHALGAVGDAAVLPGRAEADAAGEGVVVAILVRLDQRVVGGEGALDEVGDRLAAARVRHEAVDGAEAVDGRQPVDGAEAVDGRQPVDGAEAVDGRQPVDGAEAVDRGESELVAPRLDVTGLLSATDQADDGPERDADLDGPFPQLFHLDIPLEAAQPTARVPLALRRPIARGLRLFTRCRSDTQLSKAVIKPTFI